MQTDTYQVLSFVGLCEKPLCLVTEYMSHGSLLDLLNSNEHIPFSLALNIMCDVAAGMYHLANVCLGFVQLLTEFFSKKFFTKTWQHEISCCLKGMLPKLQVGYSSDV